MPRTGASRWADAEADAALDAQRKQEREAKKRLKAEKARKLEEERRAHEAPAATADDRTQPTADEKNDATTDGPPAKRRRLSPDAPASGKGAEDTASGRERRGRGGGGSGGGGEEGGRGLLRFERPGFGPCRSVENYDKLNDIEEGAYGWVARAREAATGKVVALKRLKIDPKDRGGLPVTGLREIQILKDCAHRNVVHLEEVVVGEDTSKIENIFLVLEFVEHDLKSVLEEMPEPFLASEVKTLLHQLVSGLSYLHDRWILHRDLKTSNLLLSNRGRLKIADFGMARYVADAPAAQQQLTQLVVTLWYRAPELLLGATAYGRPVDLWSVGCVLGELLTREPLLPGANEADQAARIFELVGYPSDDVWPGFRRLPHARALRNMPPRPSPASTTTTLRARFPLLTSAGAALLGGLLALDPARRPSAREVLEHEYFGQDPRMKHEDYFPTFPSKAGQERRRRRETPNAPARGQEAQFGALDFGGIFSAREKEERGPGFSLRMV